MSCRPHEHLTQPLSLHLEAESAGLGRIDRRRLPLKALVAFETVASYGSFTRAAKASFTSQSALSRHVMCLEQMLGVRLFDRKAHSLALTKAGQHLLPALVKSLDGLESALNYIRHDHGTNLRTICICMPPSFAARYAVQILRDFRQTNGEIEIDLVSSDESKPTNDFDLTVVYSKPMVTDLVTDLLCPARLRVLCHPCVAENSATKTLAEFIDANALIHVRTGTSARYHNWAQFLRQVGITGLDFERGFVFPTEMLAVLYALTGEGLVLADANLFADDIRAGRLACPFDTTLNQGYGYYLLTRTEDLGSDGIAQFRSWLIERIGCSSTPDSILRLDAASTYTGMNPPPLEVDQKSLWYCDHSARNAEPLRAKSS